MEAVSLGGIVNRRGANDIHGAFEYLVLRVGQESISLSHEDGPLGERLGSEPTSAADQFCQCLSFSLEGVGAGELDLASQRDRLGSEQITADARDVNAVTVLKK